MGVKRSAGSAGLVESVEVKYVSSSEEKDISMMLGSAESMGSVESVEVKYVSSSEEKDISMMLGSAESMGSVSLTGMYAVRRRRAASVRRC